MIRQYYWIAGAFLLLLPHLAFSQPAAEPAPATQEGAPQEVPPEVRPDRPSVIEGSELILQSMEAVEKYLATTEEKEEPAGPEALRLTARRCVELALTQNAGALVAQDDVDAARARIGQARSALLPQAKASVTFLHTEFNNTDISSLGGGGLAGLSGIAGTGGLGSVGGLGGVAGLGGLGGLGSALGGGAGGLGGLTGGLGQGGLIGSLPLAPRLFLSFLTHPIVESLTPDVEDDFRVDTLQISQALYAGGQIRAAIRASQYLAESQEWQKAATFAKLEFDSKQAFYDAAASEALVRVAEASVTTFERNLTDAQNMFEAGLISNFEVLRAKTEVGSRKANLVEARNLRRLALANLRRAIGSPQDAPLVLEPKLDWLPFTPDPAELVREAYANRPEILALEKAIAAANEDIRRAKGQYKPGVGADIRYQNVDNAGIAQPDGWTITLGAQWDITTGGKRKSEVLEAQARLRSLEHQLDDLHALVELDVTAAIIQIRDSMARISSENGTRALAQEGLRLAELRFQEGAGTQSETLDAELALTNAETSLVQALRDFAVANSSLERAVGRSWIQPDDEPKPAEIPESRAGPGASAPAN